MNTPLRRRQVLGLGFAAVGTAVAAPAVWKRLQRFPAPAEPAEAGTLASRGGAELELVVQSSPGTLPGGPAELLTYNGRSPGPLLEVKAGDQVRLRLRNGLNQPTNLHFHGLHIPPTGTGDNVFLTVPPGGATEYAFRLAKDHPAGLFYVHPHQHGLSADQVFGGLGSALVVRGDLDRIPEVAAARETVLVLKDYASSSAQDAAMGVGRMLGREGPLLTVNGEINPELPIPSGGLLRLRLLNASNARIYRLALEGHPLVLIATMAVQSGRLSSSRSWCWHRVSGPMYWCRGTSPPAATGCSTCPTSAAATWAWPSQRNAPEHWPPFSTRER